MAAAPPKASGGAGAKKAAKAIPRAPAGKASPKKPTAAPRAKPVPRTKGTPDKPPQPRRVTAAAKPKAAPARTGTRAPAPTAARAPGRPSALAPTPAPQAVPAGWLPAEGQDAEPLLHWIPVDAQTGQASAGPAPQPASDAPSGLAAASSPPAWAATPPAPAPVVPAKPAAPEAFRWNAVSILLTILLVVDLIAFAVGLAVSLATGAALLFAPDSGLAERARDSVDASSPSGIALNSVLNLVLFGVVPAIWVVGTRIKPVPGFARYLNLRFHGRDWLRGLTLVPAMLVSVLALSSIYIYFTQGPDGFANDSGENPAVDAIVANLSWPLALLIALSAGVGEEIFFRGVLQKRLGVWGQGVLFGLAHASGGYLPQIVFAAGLGIAFGYLLKRGWSLWSLILAHFLYDFALLALALAFPEFA